MVLAIIGSIAYYWISQAPKRALEKQIIAMQGMHINLNFEKAQGIIYGKDSTYTSLPEKKLIVFVDSTSCTSCFIGKLIEYFEVNDTLTSKSSQLIVILNPTTTNHENVIKELHSERFPFWCIVDTIGEFIMKNPDIPDNQRLHSFTLDEKDKIIIVGDPTKNRKIMELIFKNI